MDNPPGLNEPASEPDAETRAFVPEKITEPESPEPVPASEEDAMIEESVRFINRTAA